MKKSTEPSRGKKQCPGCNFYIGVRNRECDCGHVFDKNNKTIKKIIKNKVKKIIKNKKSLDEDNEYEEDEDVYEYDEDELEEGDEFKEKILRKLPPLHISEIIKKYNSVNITDPKNHREELEKEFNLLKQQGIIRQYSSNSVGTDLTEDDLVWIKDIEYKIVAISHEVIHGEYGKVIYIRESINNKGASENGQ